MTENEPDVCPTDTAHGLTAPTLAARGRTAPASAEGQNGDAPEVVGELLFATAEAYDGVQTLRARLSTLQSQPFDLAAASAVVELLSSARWQRARESWRVVVQGTQVQVDMNSTGADAEDEEGNDARVCTTNAVSSTPLSDSPAPRGTQRVSDLLLELGTVYGWSGIRHVATNGGRITGFGGQPC